MLPIPYDCTKTSYTKWSILDYAFHCSTNNTHSISQDFFCKWQKSSLNWFKKRIECIGSRSWKLQGLLALGIAKSRDSNDVIHLSVPQLCFPLCWLYSQADSPQLMAGWPPVNMGLQPNLAGKENVFPNKNPGLDFDCCGLGHVCGKGGILAQHYGRGQTIVSYCWYFQFQNWII